MAAIDPAGLSSLIGDIYDCALDQSLWPQTLKEITQRLGAEATSILAVEPVTQRMEFAHIWGADLAQVAADAERTNSINPFLTIGWHSQIDEPFRMRSFADPEEIRPTRYYREFMASKGWFDFVGMTLQKSAQRYTAISAPLSADKGETTVAALELMGLLGPHVRRALTIQDTLDVKERRLCDLSAALNLAQSPIFLLGECGEVLEANQAAEQFLAGEGAVRIEHGRLHFADAGVRLKVAAALGAAGKGEPLPAETAAMRTLTGRAFAIEMLPLTSPVRQSAAEAGRAVLALFIHKIGELEPLPGEVLVKLYGLTPAETRLLVLIAQGMNLIEAADALGVGEATVKTHMQHVFAKTGTRRQIEAVKLVMSALPQR